MVLIVEIESTTYRLQGGCSAYWAISAYRELVGVCGLEPQHLTDGHPCSIYQLCILPLFGEVVCNFWHLLFSSKTTTDSYIITERTVVATFTALCHTSLLCEFFLTRWNSSTVKKAIDLATSLRGTQSLNLFGTVIFSDGTVKHLNALIACIKQESSPLKWL